jgi:nitrate/nitrite-specific signal transduction histidine kinase
VTDLSGQVIAHANASVVLQHTVYQAPAQNGQGVNLNGDPSIITTQPLVLGNKQFILVGEQRLADALSPAADTIVGISVISVIALIIAVVLVIVIVAQVVNPIEQLSKTAQIIQGGNLKARAVVNGRDEIADLSQSFNNMTERLENSIVTLEDQVAERVRDISLASDVSRDVTRELDSAFLLQNVVDRTASVFSLYHVSVFLYNAKEKTLYLQRGTGDVGAKMLAAGKQFAVGDKGLVPQAAQKREAVLANDVQQSVVHLPNPLLPETRAELAIPMLFRDQLIGVLDLQARTVNRFHDEDVNILKTLAEQIATAVRNAQLFEEVQRALHEAERAN